MKVEKIIYKGQDLGMIFRQAPMEKKLRFFTPDEASLQVGKHARPKGEVIKPHQHLPVKVKTEGDMQEVLYIEKGKMQVNFYSAQGDLVDSKILCPGDILLLMSGGHGFEFLEETSMIEIKQGPYNPGSRKALDVKEKI